MYDDDSSMASSMLGFDDPERLGSQLASYFEDLDRWAVEHARERLGREPNHWELKPENDILELLWNRHNASNEAKRRRKEVGFYLDHVERMAEAMSRCVRDGVGKSFNPKVDEHESKQAT